MSIDELKALFAERQERSIEEWKAFVAFPSVSADPAHNADCDRCADWLREHLTGMGFDATCLPTASKPVVYAERPGSQSAPVVLLYGHYDVQPVDPIDLWETPPFEGTLKGDRFYARGAQDNKGQLLYALNAIGDLVAAGVELPTVKIVVEGEEESGSQGLTAHLDAWRDRLRADVLMVHDTGYAAWGAPAITMGLRGILHLSVGLCGPKTDLHSGQHGGKAPNPAAAMARLLATLHHDDGSIAVDAYNDDVLEPTDEERRLANAVPFDAAAYEREVGVPPLGGEAGLTPAERTGFRPTIDINGIHSGYGGAGMKTIIPARADARITSRLVAGQDAERCLGALVRHLEAHAPDGLKLELGERGVGGPGFRLNPSSPLVQSAGEVLAGVTGSKAALVWEGASIPVVSALAAASGAEPLLVGFGRDEDCIHAPNESFSIEQFRTGYLYVAAMLQFACPRAPDSP